MRSPLVQLSLQSFIAVLRVVLCRSSDAPDDGTPARSARWWKPPKPARSRSFTPASRGTRPRPGSRSCWSARSRSWRRDRARHARGVAMEIRRSDLAHGHELEGVVVVVDVLRAFSTAAYAFARGARAVLAVHARDDIELL